METEYGTKAGLFAAAKRGDVPSDVWLCYVDCPEFGDAVLLPHLTGWRQADLDRAVQELRGFRSGSAVDGVRLFQLIKAKSREVTRAEMNFADQRSPDQQTLQDVVANNVLSMEDEKGKVSTVTLVCKSFTRESRHYISPSGAAVSAPMASALARAARAAGREQLPVEEPSTTTPSLDHRGARKRRRKNAAASAEATVEIAVRFLKRPILHDATPKVTNNQHNHHHARTLRGRGCACRSPPARK